MSFLYFSVKYVVLFLISSFYIRGISTLKNVRIVAEDAVRAGESMHLHCEYDLEDAPLYSIKWYFNSHEFYRFVPKEAPPTKVFPVLGITVDMSESDNKSVTLSAVPRSLTGYYECEISADAPSFHTVIQKMLIIVVEKPESGPALHAEKMKYSGGEIIKANCTSRRAFPAANLTWFINDQKISDQNPKTIKYQKLSFSGDADGLENSKSILELLATPDVFWKGKLTLSCEATQFSLYSRKVTLTLLEDAPQLAHVLSPAHSCSYDDMANKILHWISSSYIFGSLYLNRR